jgi:fatty acid desaturase
MNVRFTMPPYWPTLAVAAVVYMSFVTLTWFYEMLPWWLLMPVGAYLIAWHGSLQHEVVHGHPGRRRGFNEALIFPSLWLWMPFRIYRNSHLLHHRNRYLTDPARDPESFYVSPRTWARLGKPGRYYLWIYNTALGRLLLAPLTMTTTFFYAELKRLLAGDTRHLTAWLWHIPACALVLFWVMGVCGIPLFEYLLLFVYPGLTLSALRSFVEHRATADTEQRSVIIEAGALLSLLYLNNNLHALHHGEPATPWYRLPQRWRSCREELLKRNGHYYYRGYFEVIRRHLLWPKERPYLSYD